MKKYLLLILSILFFGCDSLFGTREAEDPDENVGRSLWQQPTSPDIVLENMSNAFLERNADNYMRCLTDSSNSERDFVYFPDQETAINNPGAFSSWTLEDERRYINLIFSESSLPSGALALLGFEEFEEPSIPSDTATFEEIYDLDIMHRLENVPTRMKGIAKLRMAKDFSGNWSIYRWEDLTFGSEDDTLKLPTWSEMKARAQ